MKRCLIIGNGPSLTEVPDSFLRRYPTFGSNRIYLRFTPDYYACVNPLVIRQYHIGINEMQNCLKFIPDRLAHLVPGSMKLRTTPEKVFAAREFSPVYEGYTVTYVLMQIAYWYGYDQVGLIGVDHRYIFDGAPNEKLIADGADPNHFDPDYFSNGAQWNAPDLEKSEESYRMAKDTYRKDGREIVNLTENTALDVFPKEDWQTW